MSKENKNSKRFVCIEGQCIPIENVVELLEKTKEELNLKEDQLKNMEVYNKQLQYNSDQMQKQIEELESELRVKEDLFTIKGAISGERPCAEWYEQRYQSDCITINQLHTTIDVLTDKLARLRGQMGL